MFVTTFDYSISIDNPSNTDSDVIELMNSLCAILYAAGFHAPLSGEKVCDFFNLKDNPDHIGVIEYGARELEGVTRIKRDFIVMRDTIQDWIKTIASYDKPDAESHEAKSILYTITFTEIATGFKIALSSCHDKSGATALVFTDDLSDRAYFKQEVDE